MKWVDVAEGIAGHIFRRPADGSYWIVVGSKLCRLAPDDLAISPVGKLEHGIHCGLWLGHALFAAHGGELVRIALP